MRRVSSGYTIIEVMIFLAISLVIAASSWSLIAGKQAETDFNQKMRDTQSKLQDWINDVSTGFTGGDPSQQNCTISGLRPSIAGGGPSSTPVCVFLGKAIQFTDPSYSTSQDEEIYAYSVFGCRAVGCPSTPGSNDTFPTSMLASNPKAADGISSLDLTETFNLAPAHVSWVCSAGACSSQPTPQTSQSHIIGFFNSLLTQDPTSSNGAEDLNAYQFTFNGQYSKDSSQVDDCLKLIGSCTIAPLNNPPALTNYVVCLTDGKRTAEITITSNNGVGVSTNLKYVSC